MAVLEFIINNILTNATILIGLIVMVGMIVAKKPAEKVIIGTMKAIMGQTILGAGSGLMAGVIASYIAPMIERAFGLQGLVPMTTEIVALAQSSFGYQIPYIIVGAFVINLILARFTPLKYVFLSGHHYLYVSASMSVAMACVGVTGIKAIIIGSIVGGVCFVLLPALNQKDMDVITGGQPLAMGHFGASGYWLAGRVGSLFAKDKDKSAEDIKLPKALAFAKETPCAVAAVIFILLAVCTAAVGFDALPEFGISDPLSFVIIQSLTFGAGLIVLLQGIRMLIAELLESFEGIASKVIPDAKPALDCPVVFPYAPNSVMIGFLASTVAGLITTFIVSAVTGVFVVPPMIENFFMGGTGGVFGNARGGVKGAIAGGAVNGILFVLVDLLYFKCCSGLLAPINSTVVDPDFVWAGLVAQLIAGFLK